MRRTITRLSATIALAATAAGLAGCGTSSTAAGKGTNAPEEFGLTLAALTSRVEDTETQIARCMANEGFTYVAIDFPTIKKAMDSDQTAPGMSDEAYLKQYGLGITTQFDKPLVTFGAGPQNMTTLAGLPQSEQVAFTRALWGEAPEWNHARALEEEDFSQTGGCTRSAAELTYAASELTAAYVNPTDLRVDQDPRMVAALGKWSTCMRAKGYQYDHPDQIDSDLRDRLAAITAGQDPTALTGPALDALEQLQGEERAIAEVHTACEATHIEPVKAQVEAELFSGSPT